MEKNPADWGEKKPTEAQKKYWESMKSRKGENSPRWKKEGVSVAMMHKRVEAKHGKPKICEAPDCKGIGKWFDWCLKRGHKYSDDRKDYLRMCRSCHRAYDLTPELREKAIKNLYWKKGLPHPSKGKTYAEMKTREPRIKHPSVESAKNI